MIEFNPEVTLGNVLTIAAFLGGGLGAFYNMRNRMNMQELRLDWIDAAIEDAKRELKAASTVDWRISALEAAFKELQHWKGFVNPDGEYNRNQKFPFDK